MIEAKGQNQLLRELAKEDQDSRSGKEIARTDEERVKIVLSLVGQGELKTPEDKFNAALILDHTPFHFLREEIGEQESGQLPTSPSPISECLRGRL